MNQYEFVTRSDRFDEILEPYKDTFPSESDFNGYKNHCLRMLNIILRLSHEEPDRQEKLEIALAFHDLTVFPERTLDYLASSSELAQSYLSEVGRAAWSHEVTLMIENHHKIRRYRGQHSNLVEPFRKADWVDVSFGVLRFGLPKPWLQELHQNLPLYSLYPKTLLRVIFDYVVRHPLSPLPNLRF